MTRFFFLIIILLSSTLSFAQENKIHFKNDYAKYKDTNVLFWHDDNHVTLWAAGLNAEELDVERSRGFSVRIIKAEKDTLELSYRFDTEYANHPIKVGNIVLIHSRTKKQIRIVPYFVHSASVDITVQLGRIKTTSAEKELILAQSGLRFVSEDEVFDPNKFFRVISFTFSCNTSEMKYVINARDGKFTKEMKDIIRSLRPNSKILFADIKAVVRAGRTLGFPDLEILVK